VPRDPATTLSLAEAAVLLSSGRGSAGARLQQTVEAQLARREVLGADRDDVRADVAFALLVSGRSDRMTLDAACAHVALVARNKAVDHHRRRRHESPAEVAYERIEVPVVGTLARDLDIVSGEVHRRDVSRALGTLVQALPPSERLALGASATGTGSLGSGLGRSSHYRALGRARLRLSASVRSRIAGGLALPLLLLRNARVVRDLLAPLGAVAIAGVASVALVLPAVDVASAPAVHTPAPPQLTHVTVAAAPLPPAPPIRVIHRRLPAGRASTPHPRAARATPHPRVVVATRPVTAVPAVTRISSKPDAGLGPCRAARLCN
jgi:hypothetical protein